MVGAAEPPGDDPSPPEPVRLSLWDDPAVTRIDSSCPDGLWAIIPSYTPGRDEFERRAAEAERDELAGRFEGRRFRVTRGVELGEYDFARQRYPATIDALSSCRGSGMAITIALSRARVAEHREREGTVVGIYREWAAEPVATHIEVPEERAAELVRAPEGMLGALRGPPALRAEIIFETASARVDRRMHRDAIGETDIGAGALIQGRVVAIRITNTRTDEILLDTTAEGAP
jgi:hypothetical protein